MKAKCLPKCTLEVCSAKKQLYAPLLLWTICYKNLTAAWSAKEKCGKVTFMTCRIFRPRGCSLLLCYLRSLPSALSAREMFLPKVIYLRKFIASPHWCATYSHIILTCVLPFFFYLQVLFVRNARQHESCFWQESRVLYVWAYSCLRVKP